MSTRLTRSGQPPLLIDSDDPVRQWSGQRFAGHEQNRWYSVKLYQCGGDQYAVAVVFRTQWQGESDYSWATVGTAAEVAAWLSKLGDPPTPPRIGFPHGEQYAQRQAQLVDALRTQWSAAVTEVLDDDVFAVAQADDYPDDRAELFDCLMISGRQEIRDSAFSADELCLIADALNGTMLFDTEFRWWHANVQDAIRLNGLDEKWGVDASELYPKISSLSLLATYAMAYAMREFWRDSQYRNDPDTASAMRSLKILE